MLKKRDETETGEDSQAVEPVSDQASDQAPDQARETSPAPRAASDRRGFLGKLIVFLMVLVGGGLWGGQWVQQRYTHVFENDARVAASVISVSSRVAGWVTRARVIEGDRIARGDVLMTIDSRVSKLRLAEMAARVAEIKAGQETLKTEIRMTGQQTASRIQAQEYRVSAASASAQGAATHLRLRQSEFARAKSLLAQKVISRQRWDQARANLSDAEERRRKAAADLAASRAMLAEARAARAQTDVLKKRLLQLASEEQRLSAQRDQQRLDVADRTIRSPIDGVVDMSFINEGEYIRPGQRLLLIHDPNRVWVEANVRETDLRYVKLGAPVTISVDAFPDGVFEGKVIRIGHAATSQFALLPNPNPSGNFTKITQRLPVRIQVEQKDGRLRPGMMVEINIEIPERQ